MTRGRGPLVLEARRNLTGRGEAAAEVHGEQDLTSRRMRERRDYLVQRFELGFSGKIGGQTGSTSQIVSSSRTGPIGSHTAMTSGV